MATQLINYGTKTAVAMTSLNSLATSSGAQSAAVDNTTNKFDDVVLQIGATGSAAGNTNQIDFYVYSALGDTTYTDGATGSDAAFTAANRKNAVYIGSVWMNTTSLVIATFSRSVAACFGGIMPAKWGLLAVNNSGAALAASGHSVNFQGISYTIA